MGRKSRFYDLMEEPKEEKTVLETANGILFALVENSKNNHSQTSRILWFLSDFSESLVQFHILWFRQNCRNKIHHFCGYSIF